MRTCILVGALLPVVVLAQIPGGINDITLTPEDPVVVFAVEQLQSELSLDNGEQAVLEDIVDAKSQVTNMVNYFLKLRMTGNYVCDVSIVDNWQIGAFQVLGRPDCQRQLSARELMLGGISNPAPLPTKAGNPSDEAVLDALDSAVCAASQQNVWDKAFKIADTSAITFTSQVTAGMTYRYYNVPLVLTTCSKTLCDRDSLSACDTHPTGKTKTCDFMVHDAPFRDSRFDVSLDALADPDQISACLSLD